MLFNIIKSGRYETGQVDSRWMLAVWQTPGYVKLLVDTDFEFYDKEFVQLLKTEN